jgi:hypothetical protein
MLRITNPGDSVTILGATTAESPCRSAKEKPGVLRRVYFDAHKNQSGGFFQPRVDLALGLILRVTVSLLQPPSQFCPTTFNHFQVVIGELTPLPLHLFPGTPSSFLPRDPNSSSTPCIKSLRVSENVRRSKKFHLHNLSGQFRAPYLELGKAYKF